MKISDLKIEIYADGADLPSMLAQAAKPHVKGLTTNPTLMRKAGVKDYLPFAKELLAQVRKPVSLEVFADDKEGIIAQAHTLASLAPNVFVKVPIVNSLGESNAEMIATLLNQGVKVNVTAIMTWQQESALKHIVAPSNSLIYSVFAGRISDTGRNPAININALKEIAYKTGAKVLWASTRHPYSIREAEMAGADIITVPNEILAKAEKMFGADLTELTLETVRMFKADSAGYSL